MKQQDPQILKWADDFGNSLEAENLECPNCGNEITGDDANLIENYESISESNKCLDCENEEGEPCQN